MWSPATGPFVAHPLTGYLGDDEPAPGARVSLHVSGPPDTVAELEVRRGDRALRWGPARAGVAPLPLRAGSYLEVDPAPPRPEAFTFVAWVQPTRFAGGWSAIACERGGWGLFIAGEGVLSAVAGATWCGAKDPLVLGEWQLVAVVSEPGRLAVVRWNPQREDAPYRDTVAAPPAPAGGRLLLGAHDDGGGHPAGHFDGKLARPALVDRALADGELARVQARWDLGSDVTAQRVPDTGGDHDAVARNAPLRAVTGPGWRGRSGRRYADAPGDYDAVHLHADDLDDAAWPACAELAVPAGAAPGIHVARLRAGADELSLPFVVVSERPRAPLAFLAPTLTWQAYASTRSVHEATEDGVMDAVGGLYDLHADGTPRHLSSRLRPTRAGAPSRGTRAWGAHTVAADLMLSGGLEALGLPHDVLADRQLHARGAALLAPYRCVVLGAHPEYATAAMLDALDAYLAGGGRLVYLGGNGLYWVTSLDPGRPHLMEVRKGGLGEAADAVKARPGQTQHQTTLEDGGFWTERGRPPRALTGVEFAANGHVNGHGRRGFTRTSAARDPRYAWVFDGVEEDDPFGAYGAILGSSVGYEMDAVAPWTWSPERPAPVLLARGGDPTLYGMRHIPGSPVADIALRDLPNGGATFAAGSVTWAGSLAEHGYDNAVARITVNVVRRFLSAPRGTSVCTFQSGSSMRG